MCVIASYAFCNALTASCIAIFIDNRIIILIIGNNSIMKFHHRIQKFI